MESVLLCSPLSINDLIVCALSVALFWVVFRFSNVFLSRGSIRREFKIEFLDAAPTPAVAPPATVRCNVDVRVSACDQSALCSTDVSRAGSRREIR